MENKTEQETERWVEERMARLAAPPDWEPDASVARTRWQGRLSARRTIRAWIWLPRAAAVALACLVLLFAIPTTRALTNQLWQWLTVRQVEAVQLDFDRLPRQSLILRDEIVAGDGELPAPAEDLDDREAQERVGFTLRLPQEGVPPGPPELMTTGPMGMSTTLKVADLESALRKSGVNDQPIPKEWDGAHLSFHIGPGVIAHWGETGVSLVQHPPPTLSAPAGFDFAAYWTAVLRAAGLDREQAQQLAERMTTAPGLLLAFGAERKVAVREVNLRTGPATLIEETGKVEHVTVIWGVADRVYHLVGTMSEEQAIRAANSVE